MERELPESLLLVIRCRGLECGTYDNSGGVAQKEGAVPGLAAVPPVVEGSGFCWLGEH